MAELQHGAGARRLVSNTAALALAQGIVRAASLVAFPMLANSVQQGTYGIYNYALQVAAAWAVLANFQLKVPLIREIAREEGKQRYQVAEVVSQVFTLRLCFALGVLLLTSLWAWLDFETARERGIFLILMLGALTASIGATFDDALQAREAFKLSALASVAQGLTVSGGIIIGVVLGRPIAWAVGAQFCGAWVLLLLTCRFASREIGAPLVRWRWSPGMVRELLRLAFGVAVAAQFGAWYGRADLLVVRRLMTETELGQYSVAYRALEVVMTGVMALHMALLPMLTRAQSAGPGALAPRVATVIRFGVLAMIPFGLTVSFCAPVIMRVFDASYAPAAAPLAIIIWVCPIMLVGAVLHWVLYLQDRPWAVAGCMATGLVVNGGLGYLLCQRYGLAGAAAARVAAEASLVLPAAVLVRQWLRLPWAAMIGRPLLMGLAMGGVWCLWPAGVWWLRLPLALLAYVLAGFILKPLEPREWALLRSFRRRSEVGAGDAEATDD